MIRPRVFFITRPAARGVMPNAWLPYRKYFSEPWRETNKVRINIYAVELNAVASHSYVLGKQIRCYRRRCRYRIGLKCAEIFRCDFSVAFLFLSIESISTMRRASWRKIVNYARSWELNFFFDILSVCMWFNFLNAIFRDKNCLLLLEPRQIHLFAYSYLYILLNPDGNPIFVMYIV